ncbi:MAG: PopZ family protein [Alphaproteobacteria bacterium]
MQAEEKKSGEEVSMDEILASIKRYVSSDEKSESGFRVKEEKENDINDTADTSDDTDSDDIIHLTDSSPEASKDMNEAEEMEDVQHAEESKEPDLLSPELQESTKEAFSRLADSFKSCSLHELQDNNKKESKAITIEKFVETLASPLIKEWLDTNLSNIVESLIKKEIQRVTKPFSK